MGAYQLIRRWLGYRFRSMAHAVFADTTARRATTHDRLRELDRTILTLQRRVRRQRARAR